MVGDQALMVYVGKRSGYHHKTQDEINNLILQYAQAGSTVLRLKVRRCWAVLRRAVPHQDNVWGKSCRSCKPRAPRSRGAMYAPESSRESWCEAE